MDKSDFKKDGFLFSKNLSGKQILFPNTLILEKEKLAKTIKYINNQRIKSLLINSSYSKIDDLNFLTEITHIEDISILQNNLDLSPINYLINLRSLSFDESKQIIDFSNFPDLEVLGCNYNNKLENLESLKTLKWLYLYNYNKDDLQEFSQMKELYFFHLYNTSIKNFNGIGELSNLEDFSVDRAPKLESTIGFTEKNCKLEVLQLFNAKTLINTDSLGKLVNIKKLYLQRIPDIPNLDFLKEFIQIQTFVLGANVVNKDFKYLDKIPNILVPGYKNNTLK